MTLSCLWQNILTTLVIQHRRISSVRHHLTTKATVQLMCSFVLSRLDYYNSLLINITSDQMYRLQKIQNHAAKVVLFKSKHEHVTPLLRKLHWLPVQERILFKIATFAFRFFDGTLPPYLSSCLSVYTQSRTLRSSSDEKNNNFPVQNGNSRALVTGRSLFRRPLSGTVFLPTSDTVAPSHS